MSVAERIKEAMSIANADDRLTRLRAIVVDAAWEAAGAIDWPDDPPQELTDMVTAILALKNEIARSVPRYDEQRSATRE